MFVVWPSGPVSVICPVPSDPYALAICASACSRVSPPSSVLPTRTPGRTRPSYCWPHAYRTPTPMPAVSTKPTTAETPKKRASDRRRRGRAAGSPSVTAASRGRTGTASTPYSEVGDVSAGAASIGSSRRTSAASSGSAAEWGRSVIRCSCAVGLGRASSLETPHLRVYARICHATDVSGRWECDVRRPNRYAADGRADRRQLGSRAPGRSG